MVLFNPPPCYPIPYNIPFVLSYSKGGGAMVLFKEGREGGEIAVENVEIKFSNIAIEKLTEFSNI